MPATYEPIASTTLGSAAASVTFGSGGTLPQTYTDLVIVVHASVSNNGAGGGIAMRFNGDTGSNYSYTRLSGDGSSAFSYRRSNYTWIEEMLGGLTGAPRMLTLNVMSYANTNVNKTVVGDAFSSASFRVEKQVGLWRSTAAITSISFIPALSYNFESGSTFSLYGIKAA